MFYGPRVFDPVLIVAQIVVLQCLWYISLGCLLWLLLGASMYAAYVFLGTLSVHCWICGLHDFMVGTVIQHACGGAELQGRMWHTLH
jgi:Integral membrane protein S linking to the trans Golgi network